MDFLSSYYCCILNYELTPFANLYFHSTKYSLCTRCNLQMQWFDESKLFTYICIIKYRTNLNGLIPKNNTSNSYNKHIF